ncbi:DMT family transporter [Acaricomes phytoseiuli]|uniref:DMT family transporter n=1 Tax=Acaricomes phytoseiuli TaxID=291968 RepID=UPI00037C2012|nr:DMT family transporter [Acaricomes phytoseiuli]MCW1250535.1 DMT family transporter [Acaricomes phytoseiuli]
MIWLAVGCAIASAFFMAFGAQRQGSAVKNNTSGLALGGSNFASLLRNPRWILGLVLLATGLLLNATALSLGTLTVIQPIGAIALVITTVVNSRDQGIQLNRATVVAIVACVAGSAAFVLLALNVVRENNSITRHEEITVVLLLLLVVMIFGGAAVALRRRLKAFFYIIGAGVLFGFVAVMTKIIAKQIFNPNGLGLANIEWYSIAAIIAAGGLGSWFVQSAYASGPPDLVIAGLTVIDPMVGIAIGIVILNELQSDVPGVVAIAMAVAALIAIVGVVALSRHHPDVIKRRGNSRKNSRRSARKAAKRAWRP